MKKLVFAAVAAVAMGMQDGLGAETKPLKERLAEAGVTASVGRGYADSTRLSFTFEGFSAYIDEPKAPRPDCGWMWCMKWPGAFSDQTGQEDGVRRGYYYVYLDDIHWMNPAGTEKAKRFHDFLVTKLGFAPKAFLIGMSWGGFYSTRYASTYPDDVARIYLDAPVMSFHHFKYQGWKPAADAWPAPEGHDWKADPLMPINRAEPIAKAGIPILLLYGGSDTVVAPKENCEIFIERFKAAGGDITVFRRPAYGHHPHGFKGAGNRSKIVDFFEGRTDFTFDEAYDAIFEATTSLPDLNMRDQWKLMGDAVALTNYANLVWQTNGVAVWGRAFNRALREHAVVKVPAGDYPIEEQITIPSDRRIEADAKALIRHAPGYRGILVRNEPGARNVFVKGGVWSDDRAARNRDASGRPVNYRVLHGDNSTVFRFLGCTGLTVRDLCVSNAPAFSIQAGAVTNLVVENVVVKKGGADGVHVNGCTENVLIRNVRGLTGDDLVALNAWDWPRSTECCGPMRNVLVDNAVTDAGGYRAIRLLPGRTNRVTGEWIDCRMDGIILRRIGNVDWFKAIYQGTGDPKENRMGAGSHWYFEDCDIRFDRCEKAPEHTAVFDFGSDVDDVTLRYVNIDFAPCKEGNERRHVAKVGPWPWEPRISPTVKKLTVENLTVNGAKPEQFFHEAAYDQKGRGKFGEITGSGSDGLRPLPVARAPFEKVGTARQDALLLNSKYKAWTFGAFHEWAEFKFGDKSVMAAGEDQRMRLSGEYGYGANRTCGFGYVGVYDGKLVAEQSGKYLVWSVRLLCPGEVAEKDYSSTNDTLSVSREEKRIVWSRRSGGKDYSYELRATGPGRVEIAYDAALKVDVEQRIADDHGIKVVWTKPANGGRGRIEVDLGESALPREKARPMNTGLDFWANDAYDVPVRPTKNLIVNGGFEQGLRNWNNSTILNWQRSWDEILEKQGGSNLISVVRSPRSGNWALAFAPGNIEEVRSAPFAIFPGRPYTLSWYEKTLDPAAGQRQVGFQYQKPGGSSWTDTFKYEKVACVHAPDGKTPDADGWVRRAVSFKAVKGPGVHIRFTGQNALIDDVQVEEGDRVTDFATDPVNARIQTDTKWRFFRPGQDVKATLEVGGEKGVKAAVKVEVLNIFSETVLARDYDVDFSDATLKEFPIDLSAAIAQPGMYFVRYSFDAKGLKWRDYSRFEVAEPLRNEHPTHRLFANFWFDRSALAEDSIARMVALGWGATSWMGGDFVHTKASELFRKYHVAPMLHSVGSDMHRFREKCPHYADWKAFTEKGGLRGITNVNEKALAYIRETAYCSAMDCREDDVYWALSGEEDTLASTDERADVYAHYQKAAYEGLKKGFDERGIRFHYAPTHGTVGGSIEHGIPTIERYIRSGRKIGLEYDFIGVHMSWSIDEASVASYTDRETNHADIKAMLERNGMADAPFMQAETFYLVQQYIPEWDSVDWCDNYGGGLPSQALGNREFLHAALLCRMFLIDLESWPRALTSHPWQRPFTLDREMTTYSWSHVPSVLGHLLPDPKFLGRKKLNPVIRTLGFEQSGHGVAAIWSTDHDIERGSKSCHVVRAKLPKGVRFYDMMGAERSAKVVDGVTELPVTCAPVFLVADDAAALWAAVQAAEPPKFERVVSERYFPKKQVVWRTPKCGVKPDWSKIPEIPEHPELRMHFNGRVKVAWNGEALFVRAESKHPMMRIGFDGIGNARRALLEGLGPDDQVYDFRGRDIFRIKETNTQFAHNSTEKPGEDEMRRDFGRAFTPAADGKSGVWELRIVPRFLSPIQLKEGYRAGFRFDFAEEPVNLELGDPVDWIMLELATDGKAANPS